MKPSLLRAITLLSVVCSSSAYSQILLSWNTAGNLGTETTEASVFNNSYLTSSSLTMGTITAAGNANRFGGSGWFNTGNTAAGSTQSEAISGNDYIQFIVTPTANSVFTPTSFTFIWDFSSSGPKSVALRSSNDSFAANIGSLTNMTASTSAIKSISITGMASISSSVTFRLYGFGGTGTGGTGGFDTTTGATTPNVILYGTAIPEPSSAAALFGIAAIAGVGLRRRRRA